MISWLKDKFNEITDYAFVRHPKDLVEEILHRDAKEVLSGKILGIADDTIGYRYHLEVVFTDGTNYSGPAKLWACLFEPELDLYITEGNLCVSVSHGLELDYEFDYA